MNKRKAKKINEQRVNKILCEVEKDGWHIIEKKFINGYYIVYLGEKSVCHFRLKEFPDYLFGIWLSGKDFAIFGQFKLYLDKFKPSRNEISKETTLESFLKGLNFVYKNYDRFMYDCWFWDEEKWAISNWNKELLEERKLERSSEIEKYKQRDIKEFYGLYQLASKELFKKYPFVKCVGIEDMGDCFYPRYHVSLLYDKDEDKERLINGVEWSSVYWEDYGALVEYIESVDKTKVFRKEIKRFKKENKIDFLFVKGGN